MVIGSGNVAEAMALAISRCKDLKLRQVCARNATAARILAKRCGCAYAPLGGKILPADLYILAVSDPAVPQLSATLKLKGGVVAHTAGSLPMGEISPHNPNRAVIYPLQTFSRGRRITFSKVPLLIEGANAASLECVREVALALSEDVREVNSAHRARIHLAAVFASNFANHMYALGEELIREAGGDFDLLRPLIKETALKAASSDSPAKVQTGPAVRNDYKAKTRHAEMLAKHAEIKNIYISISNSIWETSKKI